MNPEMDADYKAIMNDDAKSITENIVWHDADDDPTVQKFRVYVDYPDIIDVMFIDGRYNPGAGKLSYTLVVPSVGRIYGLDLGMDHCNPNGEYVGCTHKNYWVEGAEDNWAYPPEDITASWSDPVEVWRQFCEEAKIRHTGTMPSPPIKLEMPI